MVSHQGTSKNPLTISLLPQSRQFCQFLEVPVSLSALYSPRCAQEEAPEVRNRRESAIPQVGGRVGQEEGHASIHSPDQ